MQEEEAELVTVISSGPDDMVAQSSKRSGAVPEAAAKTRRPSAVSSSSTSTCVRGAIQSTIVRINGLQSSRHLAQSVHDDPHRSWR